MPEFASLAELIGTAESQGKKISDVVLAAQAAEDDDRGNAWERMRAGLEVMKEASRRGIEEAPASRGGLVGGDARRMAQAARSGRTAAGGVMGMALARALAVAEVNAAMGRIVAAPTAGSCGVLPAVVLTVAERFGAPDEAQVASLFTAAGVGIVIARLASLAGAEGGCQAETGSAAAMTAAAGVELAGGSPDQAGQAAAIALKGLLGLVCDPVAGLVEVPCVKRNATATAIALAAIDLALAGVRSAIPVDEVIETMGRVGRCLPEALRETAEGGLAATPTARAIVTRLQRTNP